MDYEITGSLLATIDWDAFIKHLSQTVSTPLVIVARKATTDGRVTFETKQEGIYTGVLKSIGSHIVNELLGGVYLKSEKKTKQIRTPLYLSWMVFAGDTSGKRILNATWYFEPKEWTFHQP
jgi:hexokinase